MKCDLGALFNAHAADILAGIMNLIISDLVMQRGCLQYLEDDGSLYVDIGGSVRASADIICAMLKHDSYKSAFAADGNIFTLPPCFAV